MPRLLPWEYAIRNLGRSPWRLGLGIAGSALVVLLVIAASAFVRGLGASLGGTGAPRNALLIGAGSEESVERSEISAAVPGIANASILGIRERLGVRYVSPEIHVASIVRLAKEADETVFATFRGVRPEAFLVHSQVRVTEEALAVGRSVWMDDREWKISGRFEAPGTVMEAELWAPLEEIRVATQRDNYSCIVITMDEGDFSDVDLFAKQRLDLELMALPEDDYYAKVFRFYEPVRSMVWLTAILVAAGAFLGGLNTLYAAFAARVREMGALQVLGFKRSAIVVSLLQESILLASAGALLAALVGVTLLDGTSVRISMGAFGLKVDGPVVALGLAAGLVLGLVGALPPAWRCLKMPVAQALRSA
jgi:putative ABC transport system permease protein